MKLDAHTPHHNIKANLKGNDMTNTKFIDTFYKATIHKDTELILIKRHDYKLENEKWIEITEPRPNIIQRIDPRDYYITIDAQETPHPLEKLAEMIVTTLNENAKPHFKKHKKSELETIAEAIHAFKINDESFYNYIKNIKTRKI